MSEPTLFPEGGFLRLKIKLAYDGTNFSGWAKQPDRRTVQEEFEKAFSDKFSCKHTQAVTSGTVAQLVAMVAMGIKQGDEVITQAHTFVATVESILAIGAVPVIVDVDDTYNIDPISLENAITSKTKAIIGVPLYGKPFDIDAVIKICQENNLFLIEDVSFFFLNTVDRDWIKSDFTRCFINHKSHCSIDNFFISYLCGCAVQPFENSVSHIIYCFINCNEMVLS